MNESQNAVNIMKTNLLIELFALIDQLTVTVN